MEKEKNVVITKNGEKVKAENIKLSESIKKLIASCVNR